MKGFTIAFCPPLVFVDEGFYPTAICPPPFFVDEGFYAWPSSLLLSLLMKGFTVAIYAFLLSC